MYVVSVFEKWKNKYFKLFKRSAPVSEFDIEEKKSVADVLINHQTNIKNMAKKTVITRVLEVETTDAIVEFPQNRTLLAEQLSDEAPVKPEVVKGLRTLEDIFSYYKPNVKIEFEDPDGQSKKETLGFENLRDFEKDGLIKNSEFLKELGLNKESFQKIEKQLRSNKTLRDAITNPETRIAVIKSLQALLKELQDTK